MLARLYPSLSSVGRSETGLLSSSLEPMMKNGPSFAMSMLRDELMKAPKRFSLKARKSGTDHVA